MTPIPITRAEYEKKFGVKPVVASTSILEDEKPAPIRITRAEWEALQKEWNPPAQTYAQDAKSDIAETKRAVLDTAQRGADKLSGISNRVSSGETSKGMGAFQKFGRALITTGNMVFDTGIGVAKAVLPQKVEDSVKKFFEGFGNEITEYNKDFYEKKVLPDLQSTDPNKRDAAKLIVETLDAYKNDANFRDTADAAGGIVSALFSTKIKDGASNTLDTAIGTSKKTISTANDVISPIKKKVDERGVNNVIKEIDKIENKYVKTRNANTYSKDIEASQRRIAQSNVLDGAVDTDGVIRTKTPGGVIDQYRAQTIDGLEDIVRKGLKESKETIPVTMVRQALVREVGKSGLEGADLVTALKKIDKELEGLNIRTKGSSIVDLSYLHDNKIATTKNINYLTPPEKSTYRKAVARAYKMLVEENSTKVDVKGINKELSMYLDDIKRLERLDGTRAEGGRLGKYTASVAGTLIGGAAGSVGGGVGAAVGGIVGGEAAAALKGLGMSRTFKGGGKGLPKSAVLERARLSIPDKAIKAKAGVPKTKEITKLEKDIAKNVADQKKAIKKGDFALVAALKEVYAVLVEELKKAIKYLNENGSVGMSIKKSVTPESVAKRADDADMGVLDYVIRDYDNAILDPNVNRTLSDMGLGKTTREERIRFAKDVFDEQAGVGGKVTVKADPLVEEAKGKSLEEFVKEKTEPKDFNYSHRPTEGPRAFDLTEKVDGAQMIPSDMYSQWYGSRGTLEDIESITALKNIKGNPEAEVTIYRASPSADFNYGDWVTLSKKYAKQHAESNGDKTFKVNELKVKAKDIRWAMDDVNEFGYFPENYISQLTDIWKKANKTDPLVEEARKYKSAEEFVNAQTKFYHGGEKIDSVNTRKSRFQNTFYFTESPDYAKSYGGKNSVVNEIYLDPSANLIDLRNPSKEVINAIADKLMGKETGKIIKITRPDGSVLDIPEVRGGASNPVYTNKQIIQGIVDGKAMFIELPEVKKILKEMGYDGLITTESKMGSNYGVWNADKVKTRKQMEDVWNKS